MQKVKGTFTINRTVGLFCFKRKYPQMKTVAKG